MINREIIETVGYLLGYMVNEIEANYYISKATKVVYKYLNTDTLTDDIILEKHKEVIIELVYRSFIAKKNCANGIKSMTQGQRSVTYVDSATSPMLLDDELKALLPRPKVRLL